MPKKLIVLFLIIIAACLTSCIISAGTHGSLKSYQYQTTKDNLDSAVLFVIKHNPNIFRDTIGNKIIAEVGNGKQDTIIDNSYNDGHNYVTLEIKTDKGKCDYTFRYYGGEEDWKTSKTSEIFICYAYNEFGNGGSEGNGGVDRKTLKYLTEVFEKELVNKIDKKLNLTHTELD